MAGGIGPQIPAEIAAKLGIKTSSDPTSDVEDPRSTSTSDTETNAIGPAMPPPGILKRQTSLEIEPSNSDDDDELIGPSTALAGYTEADIKEQTLSTISRRLEQSEKRELAESVDNKREEWMLVPPTAESGNKRGSTALFDKSWTETPEEKRKRREKEARKLKRSDEAAEEEETPEMRRKRMENDEKAKWVQEYNREQRPKSLLEMHLEKKSGKKKSRHHDKTKHKRGDEAGKEDDEDDKWKKRRFDRSRDLSTGKTDSRRRRELLDSLGNLSDKYGHGKGGSFA
ncbi:hypothetical protein J3B02_005942 [Coemansia erecta]|nr:hypothetical protein J3B02_005942 [Coemansia erecta]KAJ2888698.1 hypothetical protein FB639_000454 [Coemansia asiatica]